MNGRRRHKPPKRKLWRRPRGSHRRRVQQEVLNLSRPSVFDRLSSVEVDERSMSWGNQNVSRVPGTLNVPVVYSPSTSAFSDSERFGQEAMNLLTVDYSMFNPISSLSIKQELEPISSSDKESAGESYTLNTLSISSIKTKIQSSFNDFCDADPYIMPTTSNTETVILNSITQDENSNLPLKFARLKLDLSDDDLDDELETLDSSIYFYNQRSALQFTINNSSSDEFKEENDADDKSTDVLNCSVLDWELYNFLKEDFDNMLINKSEWKYSDGEFQDILLLHPSEDDYKVIFESYLN